MKVIAKPIEVVSWIDTNGNINPVRFKIVNEDESNSVIKIDRVLCVDKEKLAGNEMLIFKCQSVIKDIQKSMKLNMN